MRACNLSEINMNILASNGFGLCIKYPYIAWDGSNIVENAENNKEENNMGNTILNLWKTQEIQKIEKQVDRQKKAIMEKDELYKITAEYTNKVKQIIEDEDFSYDLRHMTECIESHLDRDIQKEIKILNDKLNNMTKDVDKLVKEVEAQLEMAETYGQKIDILKAYDILDFNGKIKKESDTESDVASHIETKEVKTKKNNF